MSEPTPPVREKGGRPASLQEPEIITFRLSRADAEALRRVATSKLIAQSALVRQLVRAYLRKVAERGELS